MSPRSSADPVRRANIVGPDARPIRSASWAISMIGRAMRRETSKASETPIKATMPPTRKMIWADLIAAPSAMLAGWLAVTIQFNPLYSW